MLKLEKKSSREEIIDNSCPNYQKSNSWNKKMGKRNICDKSIKQSNKELTRLCWETFTVRTQTCNLLPL